MLNIEDIYLEMGIRREVYDFGSQIEGTLKERFDAIDKVAEYNQLKVVHAMQKCKVNAGCFKYASGYGYDDPGRDTLEEVYAEIFHTESALVRPQITWFKREKHVTWINKKDYNYDEDKILEVMLESIQKDIWEEQSC